MEYQIRESRFEDMDAVIRAHRTSILELCSKDYSSEQMEKWGNVYYSEEVWRKTIQSSNERHFVVEVNQMIEGFCHCKVHPNGMGEIAGLYVTSKIQGTGLARKAFELCMDFIKAHGCKKVFIFGTKTAKGFYEAMGFCEVEALNINVRGADLECFKMEKDL